MPKSLAQIQTQIRKLQAEAEALKSRETAGVVERIREAIAHYGLTPQMLFGKAPVRRGKAAGAGGKASRNGMAKGAARPAAKARKKVPAKYRDEVGNTWSGRGSRPRWLQAHLAAGKSLADFAL